MSTLRKTPIYRVLHRPNLVLGGDREAVIFSLLILGGIAIASSSLIVGVICFIIELGVISVLREIAKVDPKMLPIYFRQLKYKNYYPARSTPFRKG